MGNLYYALVIVAILQHQRKFSPQSLMENILYALIIVAIFLLCKKIYKIYKKYPDYLKKYSKNKNFASHVWFMRTAKKNSKNNLLHQASAWSYLNQSQWDHYIDSLLKPLNISNSSNTYVFESGMGSGAVLKRIHEKHPDVQLAGVDPVPSAISMANDNLPPGDYTVADGLNLNNIPSNKFDYVISHCVIIYLNNLEEAKQFCSEMLRIAKPKAQLMITSMVENKGLNLGSGNIKIDKKWWEENLENATINKIQTTGHIEGCEHQGDRYAVYFQKN